MIESRSLRLDRSLPELSQSELIRYSRHLTLNEIGLTGQRRLKSARVLVVGAGGLGSPAAHVSRRSRRRDDRSRGLRCGGRDQSSPADSLLGWRCRPAQARRGNRATARAESRSQRGTASGDAGCFERAAARVGIRGRPRRYRQLHRPIPRERRVRDGAQAERLGEHLEVRRAGNGVRAEDGPCYRCLHPEPPPPGLVPSCAEAGVLGVLPGVIGTIQATEAIKLLLGIGEPLVGRFLIYDALRMRFREIKLARDPACAVCGDSPTILDLRAYEGYCERAGCSRPPPQSHYRSGRL